MILDLFSMISMGLSSLHFGADSAAPFVDAVPPVPTVSRPFSKAKQQRAWRTAQLIELRHPSAYSFRAFAIK
jgi:hypothetical protein